MADLTTKGGTKLTERKLRRLEEEAERGFDLATAQRPRVGPGRPSLAEGESPRISYRVPPAVFAAARNRAKAEGRSLSEIAREALERYLTG